jgi:membrane dipeptidase
MKLTQVKIAFLFLLALAPTAITAQQLAHWRDPVALPARALLPPPNDYNLVHPPSLPCGQENVDLSYKVPLTPDQETRAMAIYRRSFVILSHVHCLEPWDFQEMRKGGITAVVLKMDVDGVNFENGTRAENLPNEDWLARGEREMQRVLDLAAQPRSGILIVRNLDDLRRAKRERKVGIILSFEGAKPLAGKLENLTHYYDLGLRDLQLWWAVPNELKTADNYRFSPFGEEVIGRMNDLGMVIDLSHLTPQAFGRALDLSKRPVIISHCAVAGVEGKHSDTLSGTDHLSDGAIRAMAKNRGVICLHFVTPAYIRPLHGTPQATVTDWVDQVTYIRDLVGVDYIGVGPDYFPEAGWHWIEGVGRLSMMPNVARELVRRSYSDDDIAKILGGNLMRIYEQEWKP